LTILLKHIKSNGYQKQFFVPILIISVCYKFLSGSKVYHIFLLLSLIIKHKFYQSKKDHYPKFSFLYHTQFFIFDSKEYSKTLTETDFSYYKLSGTNLRDFCMEQCTNNLTNEVEVL